MLNRIRTGQAELEKLQDAEGLVSYAHATTTLLIRLESHMNAILECDVVHAVHDTQALYRYAAHVVNASSTVQELNNLTQNSKHICKEDHTLQQECEQLDFIRPHLALFPDASQHLQEQIEDLLLCGLRLLSPMVLGLALQAAEYCGCLAEVVQNLLDDLGDILQERARMALDLNALGKDMGEVTPPKLQANSFFAMYHDFSEKNVSKEKKLSIERWTTAVWARLRNLIVDEMAPIVMKVQMLEHVLHLKYETDSQWSYLEAIRQVS